MQSLGLHPTALSGAGWLAKEDGESSKVIAQLKSTEGKSISVKRQDVNDLVKNARIARKLPIFVLSFVGEDQPWVMVRADKLRKVVKALGEAKDSRKAEEATKAGYQSNVRRSLRKASWRANV